MSDETKTEATEENETTAAPEISEQEKAAQPLDFALMNVAGVLTSEQIADLIQFAIPRLTPALCGKPENRLFLPHHRTAMNCKLPDLPAVISAKVVLAAAAGIETDQWEPAEIVRYETGGFFNVHNDSSATPRPFSALVNLSGAQAYEGGEVRFPNLTREDVTPGLGDAILWANNPADIRLSDHCVSRVQSGEKWTLVLWSRARGNLAPPLPMPQE